VIIGSSGAYFDQYSRRRVEEAFDTWTFDIYAATESGPMAFECREKRYHVLSDFVCLEVLRNGENVSCDETGSLVVTKLYGAGTPIIRYTGIDDVITPARTTCSCGLAGDFIESIHGRKSHALLLPGGKLACISLFDTVIGEILTKVKAIRLKRMQIIQHTLDRVEIKIAYDTIERKKTSTDTLFSSIRSGLLERLGSDIDLVLTQVDGFDSKAPYVINKIWKENWEVREYLI
jgi:phenylacetate-CoA ligase